MLKATLKSAIKSNVDLVYNVMNGNCVVINEYCSNRGVYSCGYSEKLISTT